MLKFLKLVSKAVLSMKKKTQVYLRNFAQESFSILGRKNKFSSKEGRRVRFFFSVSNLMNEVLINIMALINEERD